MFAKGLGDVNCYVLTEKTIPQSVDKKTEKEEEQEDLNSTANETEIYRLPTMAAEPLQQRRTTRVGSLIDRLNLER